MRSWIKNLFTHKAGDGHIASTKRNQPVIDGGPEPRAVLELQLALHVEHRTRLAQLHIDRIAESKIRHMIGCEGGLVRRPFATHHGGALSQVLGVEPSLGLSSHLAGFAV